VIGLQSLEAGLAGPLDPAPTGVLRVDLAHEEDLVPDASQSLAD
jgi:hypothetical protein